MENILRVVGGVFYKIHPDVQLQLFRKTSGSIAGFFEFPGGKIEPGENAEQALIREIKEELKVAIAVQDFIGKSTFDAGDRRIELTIFLMEQTNKAERFQMQDHDQILWLRDGEESRLKIAPGDLPLLPKIFAKIKTKI